jgi:hypothetical protein
VETVVRVRGSGRDEYGDPVASETRVTMTTKGIAPRYTSDPADPTRAPVIDGFTVYLLPGADVLATDRLEVRGGLYDVDGQPGEWVSPFSGDSRGVEVNVRRGRG